MASTFSVNAVKAPTSGRESEHPTDVSEISNLDMAKGDLRSEVEIDWKAVDEELKRIATFDVVGLASTVVGRALNKGSQNVYNEAGVARFQIAKLKQQFAVLKENICGESLDSKNALIMAIESSNAKKSLVVSAGTGAENVN